MGLEAAAGARKYTHNKGDGRDRGRAAGLNPHEPFTPPCLSFPPPHTDTPHGAAQHPTRDNDRRPQLLYSTHRPARETRRRGRRASECSGVRSRCSVLEAEVELVDGELDVPRAHDQPLLVRRVFDLLFGGRGMWVSQPVGRSIDQGRSRTQAEGTTTPTSTNPASTPTHLRLGEA